MAKFYWYLGHEQFQPEIIVKHAQAAEAAGFDGVMVSDHLNPWVADAGASGFVWPSLGAIASSTKKLSIMTYVTAPLFRMHPALIAQAAATVDRLSGGRFELGLGTGENLNEAPLGYSLPTYGERIRRLKEALEIMQKLFAGQKLDFDGQFYKVSKLKLYSPPTHKIPVYMAAGGPQSAKFAGTNFDGIIMSVKDVNETIKNVVDPARAAAGKKDFKLVASHWTIRGKNPDEVWRALKPWRGLRSPNRLSEIDPEVLQKTADELPRQTILDQYDHVSTADDYIRAYSPLVSVLKAQVVGIQTSSLDQLETIDMLGKSVLPQLHKLTK